MIRWCAYCQSYQGERPPFDDFSFTHTICPRCAEAGKARAANPDARIARVRDLFARIARPFPDDTPERLVAEALDLGIAPLDLLLGIVQPVLCEVGERWARGEATVAQEHEVTRRCLAIYDALRARSPSVAPRPPDRLDVLLAGAPGNAHFLGLRVVELFLAIEGLAVESTLTPLTADALVAIVREKRPCVLALSAALPEHLAAAEAIASRLQAHGAPEVVVGGRAVHDDASGGLVRRCPDFRELPRLVSRLCGLARRELEHGA